MKKQLLSLMMMSAVAASAQKTDSVILDANYAKQVWYSMDKGAQGSAAKDNWDIAFDVVDIMSSVHVNTAAGAMLWHYPKGDKSAWSSVDTNGLSTWTPRYNSDTSWAEGAMGNYKDPSNPFDLDWGIYNMGTHIITGDSLYIIKLVNGDYKKLMIEKLQSGTFYFKYENLDGSNAKSEQVAKSTFANKNLGYYSISSGAVVNREPDIKNWDLVFTSYTGFVPVAYTVTGVLQNRGVKVAEATNIPNKSTYMNWQSHSFSSEINTIGYDWKKHVGGGVYSTQDSLVYFVAVPDAETGGENVWKLVFSAFETSNGKFVFNKQNVQAASVYDEIAQQNTTLALSPNPANGSDVQIIYSVGAGNPVTLQVVDMTGKLIFTDELMNNNELNTYVLPTGLFKSGFYIVSINTATSRVQQKLLVN